MIEERIEKAIERLKREAWATAFAEGRAEGLAESRADGRNKGLAKGLAKGRYEEAKHFFLELFKAKFEEPASVAIRKRAQSATCEELEDWCKRLLKADTPADIFDT